MIRFRPLEIGDWSLIKPYFEQYAPRLCEHTATLCLWRGYFSTEISIGESLFIKQYSNGDPVFHAPVGGDFIAGMETVLSYCRTYKHRAIFPIVSGSELEKMRSRYTLKSVIERRDWYDYLYDSRDLIELKGRKFHGQRNHISRFDREYPHHEYLPLTDIEAAKAFLDRFYKQRPPGDHINRFERTVSYEVLEHWDTYGQLGGVLTVDGGIVSLSVGEVLGDTLFVHIEKADASFAGAYQKTVNSFAAMYGGGVRYINREEDMGIEGLRRSKLSYHPVALLEKYMVEIEL
jgi:hypothetical protein